MDHSWLYDERKQIGTDYADDERVTEYDTGMQRLRNVSQEVEKVAQALIVSPFTTIWEIGCGTGEMALGLAARCRHVYATDVSPAMIRFARRKATERRVRNVTFQDGGFLSGYVPPEPVDGAVSQLTLHHLPDMWKLTALRRVAHHLRPNGRLFLRDIVYPSGVPDYDAYFAGLIATVRSAGGDDLADETIAHIREEYSTFAWIMEEMLKQSGFSVTDKLTERFTTSYICIRQWP